MNLMFRKNFREQKSGGGKSGLGKGGAGRHSNKKSSREPGYTPIEEHHYRTHLFFSPPRCTYGTEDEGITSLKNILSFFKYHFKSSKTKY